MREHRVTALNRMVETVNAGDAAGYASVYADDAVVTVYGTAGLRGRAAIEQHEVELLRQFPGARLGFYSVWQQADSGADVVVHYGVNAPLGSGRTMGHEGLLFFRFDRSGHIREERRYQDSLTPMAQVGAISVLAVRPPPPMPARTILHEDAGGAEDGNAALLRSFLQSLDARKADAVTAVFADECELDDMVLPDRFAGRAGVRQWFDIWSGAFPVSTTEITTAIAAGAFVLAETVVRGTMNGSFGPVSASRQEFLVHRGLIAEMRDGRIARLTAFMNGKELAECSSQSPR